MKSVFWKLMSAFVLVALLVCGMTLTSVAAEAGDIVNLYDEKAADIGTAPTSKDGEVTLNEHYYTSHAIKVDAGDVITIGPVLNGQSWFIMAYNASGGVSVSKVKPTACKQVDVVCNNAVILNYTVPEGTAYIRVTTSQMFCDSTLITKNRSFTAEEYFAYMDAKGINMDYLRPTDTNEPLVNYFPVSDKTYEGAYHATKGKVEKANLRSCEYIPMQKGDVLYFAAASKSQGYHLCIADEKGNGVSNIQAAYMVLYEDLGRGFAIYAYRMRSDASLVSVVATTGVYNDGITLATVNQPFTGDTYREMFGIELKDYELDESSPLNGLTGLFMGDSISKGSGDYATYTSPVSNTGWAGRIQALTGLRATNASVGGAKASYISGDDTSKWLFNQHKAHIGKKFDIIVMHGGVNDARHTRQLGTVNPVDSSEEILQSNISTYAGGLQWLFHNIKKNFPDSTLFFIANHRLDGHTLGYAKNMTAFFNVAEELCEMYGVNFIDLYNNKELNDKLETTTTKYLPDTLHLNGAGYDIVTPYIIDALEAVMAPAPETTTAPEEVITSAPETTTEAVAETTSPVTTEAQEVTTDVAVLTTEAPETTSPTVVDESNNSVLVIAVVIAAVLAVAVVVFFVIRKNKT